MWSIRVLQVDGKEVEIRRDVCFMDGKCQILFSTVGKEKAALDDDQLSHVLFGLMNDEAIKSFTVEKCHSDI